MFGNDSFIVTRNRSSCNANLRFPPHESASQIGNKDYVCSTLIFHGVVQLVRSQNVHVLCLLLFSVLHRQYSKNIFVLVIASFLRNNRYLVFALWSLLLLVVVGIAKRKTYLEIARLCDGESAGGSRRDVRHYSLFAPSASVRQTLVLSTWTFLCALGLNRPLCHFWTTTPISGLVTAAAQIANKKQIGFRRWFELDSVPEAALQFPILQLV